jgi:hypothetical protein
MEVVMRINQWIASASVLVLGLWASTPTLSQQTTDAVPNPKTAAQVPAPAPGPWTPAYVQLVGRMAYVWGWPLAVQINQRAIHADVTEPMMFNGVGAAPVNQLVMWHDYVDPSERSLGDPNQGVVYGLSYMDLGKEPVIVQVPEFGDRYWVIEVEDARAGEFSELGKQAWFLHDCGTELEERYPGRHRWRVALIHQRRGLLSSHLHGGLTGGSCGHPTADQSNHVLPAEPVRR